MSEIVPFDFHGNQVRVVMIDGEPWWVVRDVCVVLGISDAAQAAQRLDEADRCQTRVSFDHDQPRSVWVANESGLNDLILDSRKPAAREMRRWLTREVLPQIRRTGSYVQAPDSYLKALEAAAQIERQRIALATEVQQLAPKAAEHDVFLASGSNAYAMRTVAKSMGTGLTRLYRHLRQLHVLYEAQQDGNHPYQEYGDRGWFDVRFEPTENGRKWVHVPYVTPKGVSGIYRKLRDAGYDVDEPTELLA